MICKVKISIVLDNTFLEVGVERCHGVIPIIPFKLNSKDEWEDPKNLNFISHSLVNLNCLQLAFCVSSIS